MKNPEWTYRPKYTVERLAHELGEKSEKMKNALVALLVEEKLNGKDPKDIVFDAFMELLDDFQWAQDILENELDEEGTLENAKTVNNDVLGVLLEHVWSGIRHEEKNENV